MIHLRRRPPLLGLTAILVVACSSSSSPPPLTNPTDGGASTAGNPDGAASSTGPSVLTPEQQIAKFCDDLNLPLCDALFACCTTDADTLATYGGSVEGCKTSFATSCTKATAPILPLIKAGKSVLDEARLASCVATLAGMKPGGSACSRPPLIGVLELDCFAAFRGTIAGGQPCDATGLTDRDFVTCKEGRCVSGTCVPFLPSGAACNPTTDNTKTGGCNYVDAETCAGTGTAGRCQRRGAVGADCNPNAASCESDACVATKCVSPPPDLLCKDG